MPKVDYFELQSTKLLPRAMDERASIELCKKGICLDEDSNALSLLLNSVCDLDTKNHVCKVPLIREVHPKSLLNSFFSGMRKRFARIEGCNLHLSRCVSALTNRDKSLPPRTELSVSQALIYI